MSEYNESKLQNVVLKGKREIKITGILSVDSFDETRICATCNDESTVVVEGANLSIKVVNPEDSFIEAVGDIQGFFYDEMVKKTNTGILRRLFSGK